MREAARRWADLRLRMIDAMQRARPLLKTHPRAAVNPHEWPERLDPRRFEGHVMDELQRERRAQ